MARSAAFLLTLAMLFGCSSPEPAPPVPPDPVENTVTDIVTTVDMMRESLALTIDSSETVDAQTFARVCRPVGQRAQAFARPRGWTFQQLAQKNRNPANALDAEAQQVHDAFASNPDRNEQWMRTTRNGDKGWRYFRRITVQPSCMACHGAKDERPSFVKTGYPEDRAYGFEPGDLRGVYSVFVPDADANEDNANEDNAPLE
mgnify:CR=1 FL=1